MLLCKFFPHFGRSNEPSPQRSRSDARGQSTVQPFLEVLGDPFIRFHLAFKVRCNLYNAVRPLGRDPPYVVYGVRYLQCWDLRRRRVGHGVVFMRIAGRPACTFQTLQSSSFFAAHECRDALKRSRIGPLSAVLCSSVPSIGVISIRPNQVLVVHLCLSFPSILQTRRARPGA
jgi:hypothetical protein